MRDPAGEHAQTLQFLAVQHLLFQAALLGDVLPSREDQRLLAQFHSARREPHDADLAVFASNFCFQPTDLPLVRKLGVHGLALFRVDPQSDLGRAVPNQLRLGVARDLAEGLVAPQQTAIG